ncbi:kinase-like protein, partial [Athelia psychrophila]
WSKIRHPNILQFLGANVWDDRPFIVMPYLAYGNARSYIQAHPQCNRIKILHGVSLGLVHLHSQEIVHGDLKALNVLIDDSHKAVLCDFGLSRAKADATSRTVHTAPALIVGSRNWMAPERILGGSLNKQCDIYAFGMTLFEVFTDEIPLGHIDYGDFYELVIQRDLRPERPEDAKIKRRGLSDAMWDLAQRCWKKSANERPTA